VKKRYIWRTEETYLRAAINKSPVQNVLPEYSNLSIHTKTGVYSHSLWILRVSGSPHIHIHPLKRKNLMRESQSAIWHPESPDLPPKFPGFRPSPLRIPNGRCRYLPTYISIRLHVCIGSHVSYSSIILQTSGKTSCNSVQYHEQTDTGPRGP
jgi:hypothetical protein